MVGDFLSIGLPPPCPRHRPAGHPVTHSMHPLALHTYSSPCLECSGLANLGIYSHALLRPVQMSYSDIPPFLPHQNGTLLSCLGFLLARLTTWHSTCVSDHGSLEYVLHERRVVARAVPGNEGCFVNEWIQCWLRSTRSGCPCLCILNKDSCPHHWNPGGYCVWWLHRSVRVSAVPQCSGWQDGLMEHTWMNNTFLALLTISLFYIAQNSSFWVLWFWPFMSSFMVKSLIKLT